MPALLRLVWFRFLLYKGPMSLVFFLFIPFIVMLLRILEIDHILHVFYVVMLLIFILYCFFTLNKLLIAGACFWYMLVINIPVQKI